jgi:hypothetical protein
MSQSKGFSRPHELLAIVAFVGVAAGLLQLSGCDAKGTVTGKVTFKGTPLLRGAVIFYDRDGENYLGQIQRDGSYTVANIPCGPMRIAVFGRGPAPPPLIPPPGGLPIPKHYGNVSKSGLELDVRPGSQVFMIDLNDDYDPDESPFQVFDRSIIQQLYPAP